MVAPVDEDAAAATIIHSSVVTKIWFGAYQVVPWLDYVPYPFLLLFFFINILEEIKRIEKYLDEITIGVVIVTPPVNVDHLLKINNNINKKHQLSHMHHHHYVT